MANIFFTSDTHFAHDKPFIYESRGFKNIYEHDEQIIKNWNSVVKPEDTVYHLGDLYLNDEKEGLNCIRRLNGHIFIAIGNHDTENRIEQYMGLYNVSDIQMAYYFKNGKRHFYLSHFPMMIGPIEDRHGLICLHGHTHSTNPYEHMAKCRCYNVGLDAHNLFPVSIEQVKEDFALEKKRLLNF